MRKVIIFLLMLILQGIIVGCNHIEMPENSDYNGQNDNSMKNELQKGDDSSYEKMCFIYYDLNAADAIATEQDGVEFDDKTGLYFSKVPEGSVNYIIFSATRNDYILRGWLKEDGSKFIPGTPILSDIILKAEWVDKNDTPLVY